MTSRREKRFAKALEAENESSVKKLSEKRPVSYAAAKYPNKD
jgi:hypothetical protein